MAVSYANTRSARGNGSEGAWTEASAVGRGVDRRSARGAGSMFGPGRSLGRVEPCLATAVVGRRRRLRGGVTVVARGGLGPTAATASAATLPAPTAAPARRSGGLP